MHIARDLAREFPGRVIAAEPNIAELPASLSEAGVRLTDIAEALQADVVLLLVDHREFRAIMPEFAPEQTLIDTRGLWKS